MRLLTFLFFSGRPQQEGLQWDHSLHIQAALTCRLSCCTTGTLPGQSSNEPSQAMFWGCQPAEAACQTVCASSLCSDSSEQL